MLSLWLDSSTVGNIVLRRMHWTSLDVFVSLGSLMYISIYLCIYIYISTEEAASGGSGVSRERRSLSVASKKMLCLDSSADPQHDIYCHTCLFSGFSGIAFWYDRYV